MKLLLENIGVLKSASVNLRGITLIAGENDSGKSTVGKILFSMIKADNIAEHKLKSYMEGRRKELLEKIKTKLVQTTPSLVREVPTSVKSKKELERLSKTLLGKGFEKEIGKLKLWVDEEKAFLERRRRELYRQIVYNFGALETLVSEEGKVSLFAKDGTELYRVRLTSESVSFHDNVPVVKGKKVRPFKDATFVCTPVVMDLVEFFYRLVIKEKEKLKYPYPFIMRDLVRKLLRERRMDSYLEIVEEIKKIIGGNLKLEKEEILFEKGGKLFKMLGTATGIKSFGILLLLLENGAISHDSLLIIDEPEVHLHPKWQLEYVRVLVKIYEALGTKILLTTHSPYIVQALRYYTENIAESVDFYLAENGKLRCVNNEVGTVFELLGEPLWKVV